MGTGMFDGVFLKALAAALLALLLAVAGHSVALFFRAVGV